MNKKYWLEICEKIGEKTYLESKKISKNDREKDLGRGFSGDKTLIMDDIVETITIDILQKTGKSFKLISEERGEKIVGKNPEVAIILDPLDGSDNFKHDIPLYCVSIAVANSDELNSVEVAYIRNLVTGDVYYALQGEGAYKNGEKIIVSKKDGKVILTEFTKPHASRFVKLNEKYDARKLGCVCLTMCFVAEGIVDACVLGGMGRSVDVFAGYLIAKEAGGIITNWKNENIEKIKASFDVKLDLIISSNEEIHSQLLPVLGD